MAEEEKEEEKNEKKNSGWIRKGLHYGCLAHCDKFSFSCVIML